MRVLWLGEGDLFHVVGRFGREVVDRVHVDQANTLRAESKARQVIKRSRWLLLRNRDDLKTEQAIKLEAPLAANKPLATVYLLKTELRKCGTRHRSGKVPVDGKLGSNSPCKVGLHRWSNLPNVWPSTGAVFWLLLCIR